MIEFKKAAGRDPGKGEWSPSLDRGRRSALIGCPSCGCFGSLGNHQIAADGTVSPSLVCPWEPENGCKFHDNGKLVGWDPTTGGGVPGSGGGTRTGP
jgi:hypothetical protein